MTRITVIDTSDKVREWTRPPDHSHAHPLLSTAVQWTGTGLPHAGLAPGPADPDHVHALLHGRHPRTGDVLRTAKKAVHPAARLDAGPFAAAVRERADRHGCPAADLFTAARARQRWARLERVLATPRADRTLPIADLDYLARDADLPVEPLYADQDLAAARAARHRRTTVGNAGLAMTVDYPKSVSAFAMLTTGPLGRAVADHVHAAATETVAAAEAWIGYALSGHQGEGHRAERITTLGLLAAVASHGQAAPTRGRPGDPHLCTRILLPNLAPCPDGRWRSPARSMRDFFWHAPALGEFAKARLRTRLQAHLGIRFTRDPHSGEWEIDTIPADLRARWSTRRHAIEHEAAPGAGPVRRRVASRVLVERDASTAPVLPERHLLAHWRAEAREHLGDVDTLLTRTVPGPAIVDPPEPTAADIAQTLRLPARAATRRIGIARREVLAAVLAAVPNLPDHHYAQHLTDQVLQQGGFTPIPADTDLVLANSARYTVPRHLGGSHP